MPRTVTFSAPLWEALATRARADKRSRPALVRTLLADGLSTPGIYETAYALLDDPRVQEPVTPSYNMPFNDDLLEQIQTLATTLRTERSVRPGQMIAAILWHQLDPRPTPRERDTRSATEQSKQSVTIRISAELNALLIAESRYAHTTREELIVDWLTEQLDQLDAGAHRDVEQHRSAYQSLTLSQDVTTMRIPRRLDQRVQAEVVGGISKRAIVECLLLNALAAHGHGPSIHVSTEVYARLQELVAQQQGTSINDLAEQSLRRDLGMTYTPER